MANKETTYKPTPQYLFGGLREKISDRQDARKDYKDEKKEKRKESREAKKASRVSKREDIKSLRLSKREQIAEIKGGDMTRSEKRLAIRDVRGGFREDKKARKVRKRTEIKGIKSARKLDKAFAKSDKLSAIGRTGGIRGKIAQMRADRIDRRMSDSKGKYGRWEDKMPDKYYGEGFEERGGYKSMVEEGREDWRKERIAEKAELDDEGNPISPVEDRFGTDVTGATGDEQSDEENDDNDGNRPSTEASLNPGGTQEGPRQEDDTFEGGGFTIKYDDGGMTVKLLKKLKDKTKNEKKKALIQARIEKKEHKKVSKEHSKLGFGKGSLRKQIKVAHKEKTEEIKKKHDDDKVVEKLEEKKATPAEVALQHHQFLAQKKRQKEGMTIPNYKEGGGLYDEGGYTPQTKMSEEELSKKAYGETGKPQTQQDVDSGNIDIELAKKLAVKSNVNWADFGKFAGNAVKEGITGEAFAKMLSKWKLSSGKKGMRKFPSKWKLLSGKKGMRKFPKGEHGMKVDDISEEGGHGILILLGKKSDKKKKS